MSKTKRPIDLKQAKDDFDSVHTVSGLGEAIGAHLANTDEQLAWALEAIRDLEIAVTLLTEEVIRLRRSGRRSRR